jgi:hypothetical protein
MSPATGSTRMMPQYPCKTRHARNYRFEFERIVNTGVNAPATMFQPSTCFLIV